ncbi:MAG: 30S ribosomal protein S8 [Candidatus Taylorbacteria bacterium]|nr:30S ribosomal protein S8 [Candidatus Taylorbacteria bacterium]
MVTDPISDFITRIKNASDAGKATLSIPYSSVKENIAHVLQKGGYISSIEAKGKGIEKTLELTLVYMGNEPRVHGVDRISKSSRRIYQKAKDIRMFKSGFGNVILSTPKGVLLDADAKKHKVGGEVLFKIW